MRRIARWCSDEVFTAGTPYFMLFFVVRNRVVRNRGQPTFCSHPYLF